MRGKVQSVCDDLAGMGITPAYAGKSEKNAVIVRSLRDHPRVCGEKSRLLWEHFENMGSPPRMRGKVLRA